MESSINTLQKRVFNQFPGGARRSFDSSEQRNDLTMFTVMDLGDVMLG